MIKPPAVKRGVQGKVRVLVMDDEFLIHDALSIFSKDWGFEVVGRVMDTQTALKTILAQEPDVLVLDLEMARVNSLVFMRILMECHPLPVVALSTFHPRNSPVILRALELGAVEVLGKPGQEKYGHTFDRLARTLKAASAAKPRRHSRISAPSEKKAPLGRASKVVTAIGASTGGTEALMEILPALPADQPGLVVIQQLPPFLAKDFARKLDEACRLRVREARDGDTIRDGQVLIAPGDSHLVVDWACGEFKVSCFSGPAVNHSKPSIDVLFHSVARTAGPDAVGVLLTGMGPDGAGGLLALREAGAFTLAQDEGTSVVFGTPKEALSRGAVDCMAPLHAMAAAIQNKAGEKAGHRKDGNHDEP